MRKRLKAALCSALTATMLFTAATPAFAAVESGRLRFNSDGKFKLMQISDTQDTNEPARAMLMLLEKALDEEKPDLVVFTGDNIAGGSIEGGEEETYEAIRAVVQPVADRGIPFTVTFGNHDSEGAVSRERQLEMYQSFKGCLAYDAVPEMYGTGTHNLPIYASAGNEIKFNLWMIDSNQYDSVNGGYDYVHADQIAWYEQTSKELEKSQGHLVPSISFQHIIVPEAYDLLFDAPVETAITKAYNSQPKALLLRPKLASGLLLEFPCPPNTNSGQFASWVERGDVIAAAFGHDHINTFVGTIDGIDLIMTPGMTYHSYGRYFTRGVRVFELNENDPWNYSTHLYTFNDAFGWGPYSWYVAAHYGNEPQMWIPLVLTGVAGVGAAAALTAAAGFTAVSAVVARLLAAGSTQ